MSWILIVVLLHVTLCADGGLVKDAEKRNIYKHRTVHVPLQQESKDPPCKNRWIDVCHWGCPDQYVQTKSGMFTLQRRRKCLNCECRISNGRSYTSCIDPKCTPVPWTCKKVSRPQGRCCRECDNIIPDKIGAIEVPFTFPPVEPFTFPPFRDEDEIVDDMESIPPN